MQLAVLTTPASTRGNARGHDIKSRGLFYTFDGTRRVWIGIPLDDATCRVPPSSSGMFRTTRA
ncbi:MAG: hypothetical protein GYA24_19800 [Candidatus Lokiarchaeota archaeon]|nr:hypothetical protein [Candidatus Lokiarchaeota archaeon]